VVPAATIEHLEVSPLASLTDTLPAVEC